MENIIYRCEEEHSDDEASSKCEGVASGGARSDPPSQRHDSIYKKTRNFSVSFVYFFPICSRLTNPLCQA